MFGTVQTILKWATAKFGGTCVFVKIKSIIKLRQASVLPEKSAMGTRMNLMTVTFNVSVQRPAWREAVIFSI